jgi:hypothetical protein
MLNGAHNPFYESMGDVSPGDPVFSFVNTRMALDLAIRSMVQHGSV